MRLSEIVSDLERDPRLEFISEERSAKRGGSTPTLSTIIAMVEYGCIKFYDKEFKDTVEAIDIERIWKPVRKPISFVELLDRYESGDRVSVTYKSEVVNNYCLDDLFEVLARRCDSNKMIGIMKDGEWQLN